MISFGTSWIPVVGGIVGAASDIADVTGATDAFINENKQQIATLTDFIYLRLLKNQGKGFFFFDVNQLNDIQGKYYAIKFNRFNRKNLFKYSKFKN